ncbi:MAG: hypothetical protein NVS4B6_31090 [Mycobacterium sp.]
MTEYNECPGTRQPTVNRFKRKPSYRTGDYGDRYGYGQCSVCGKSVTCHKDKTAVRHKASRQAETQTVTHPNVGSVAPEGAHEIEHDEQPQKKQVVYAVTSGLDSAYSVALLFTTQELADAFCERENNRKGREIDYYVVEKLELWDELPGEAITVWRGSVQMENGLVTYRDPTYLSEQEPWGESSDWAQLTIHQFGKRTTAQAVTCTREETDRLLSEWVEQQMRLTMVDA